MENRKLMELYLENKELAFTTWYEKTISKEIGVEDGELTGAIPPVEDIIAKFKGWCLDNVELLKKCICEDFNYAAKKEAIKNTVDLAMLLLPFVEKEIDFPYEVVAMIILLDCDYLCTEIDQNK